MYLDGPHCCPITTKFMPTCEQITNRGWARRSANMTFMAILVPVSTMELISPSSSSRIRRNPLVRRHSRLPHESFRLPPHPSISLPNWSSHGEAVEHKTWSVSSEPSNRNNLTIYSQIPNKPGLHLTSSLRKYRDVTFRFLIRLTNRRQAVSGISGSCVPQLQK